MIKTDLSDEYIKQNWHNFIMTSSNTPNQNDDEVLENEYGDYLYEKYIHTHTYTNDIK
ncbi:MAG: hypothetical protein RL344_547 [Pseudomonadota bacterium]|jgi:hypothetical protein